jgi:hypothetical protein
MPWWLLRCAACSLSLAWNIYRSLVSVLGCWMDEWNTACSTFGFMLVVMQKQGTFVARVWIYAL